MRTLPLISNKEDAKAYYRECLKQAYQRSSRHVTAVMRFLARSDLFFLLSYVLHRPDVDNPPMDTYYQNWCFDRCREVQNEPDGCMDLWAREHYKSTVITFALTIQDILNDPELTVGIFSHKSKIAKDFAVQIKREFEDNNLLKSLFPEIFWKNPRTEAPKWSDDEGFVIKRQGNPKEATVEPWGLIDGQPTGRHFKLMVYDDVVTRESVTNPEMIAKTNQAWSDSLNLTAAGGRIRYIGTRWNYADTYQHILKKGTVKLRFHPGVDSDGNPVYWDDETIIKKRKEMGPKTFAAQILLDPKQAETVAFDKDWLQWWDGRDYRNLNIYAVWDPATTKGKKSDYTVSWVFGVGADENIYIISGTRRKWGLEERQVALFNQYKTYKPKVVGYESTGPNVDLEHYDLKMREQHFHFQIKKLDDRIPKEDRIDVLRTKFIQKKIFLPERIIHTNDDGVTENLIEVFLEDEFFAYPNVAHDDMLDCLANIFRQQMQVAIQFPSFQGQDEETFLPQADNSMDMWDAGDSAFD